jgi:hypothetical protein
MYQQKIMTSDFEQEKKELAQQRKTLHAELIQSQTKNQALEKALADFKREAESMQLTRTVETAADVLKQSLSVVLVKLKQDESHMVLQAKEFQNQVVTLEAATAELGAVADAKEQELKEFQATADARLRAFTQETRAKWEAAYAAENQKLIAFEDGLAPLRTALTRRVDECEQQIVDIRRENEAHANLLLAAQKRRIEEVEAELEYSHVKTVQEIRKSHDTLVASLEGEREKARAEHEALVAEIRAKHQQDLAAIEADFLQQMSALKGDKAELQGQLEVFRKRLDETALPICSDCEHRKEVIRRLTRRRDELQLRFDELTRDAVATELKVNALFPRKIVTPRSPTLTRPVSSLQRSITTPR